MEVEENCFNEIITSLIFFLFFFWKDPVSN